MALLARAAGGGRAGGLAAADGACPGRWGSWVLTDLTWLRAVSQSRLCVLRTRELYKS